jgi:RimJ/RimL family protein N-acetyltransferase
MPTLLSSSKGKLLIRPALPADAASLRALRLEALANHPEVFSADYALSAAESIDAWAERIAAYSREELGVICLASTENELIGMLGLVRGHWPKTRHSASIWGVYVKAGWRGLHVAEALVDECLDWARVHDLTVVKLAVITTNTSAIRCYARCGFSVYGIEPQAISYNGIFYDELLMSRPL